jgi:hypothetical protein
VLEAGRSIRWVADVLGHADPSLTLRTYAHALRSREDDLSFAEFGGTQTAPDGTKRHLQRQRLAAADPSPESEERPGNASDRRAGAFSTVNPGRGGRARTGDLRLPKPPEAKPESSRNPESYGIRWRSSSPRLLAHLTQLAHLAGKLDPNLTPVAESGQAVLQMSRAL